MKTLALFAIGNPEKFGLYLVQAGQNLLGFECCFGLFFHMHFARRLKAETLGAPGARALKRGRARHSQTQHRGLPYLSGPLERLKAAAGKKGTAAQALIP